MTKTAETQTSRHRFSCRRNWGLLGIIASSSVIWIAAILFTTGKTLALWNGEVAIPTQQVTSGTFGIKIATDGQLGETAQFPSNDALLFPGQQTAYDFIVSNTGSTTAALSASLDDSFPATPHLSVTVAEGRCGRETPSTPQSSRFALLEPNASADFCLLVTLDEQTPNQFQGQSLDFAVTIDATQEVRK